MASADKNKVIVLAVIDGGMSVAEAGRRFGVTRQWVHRLLARYRSGGLDALEPGSRAPLSSPHAVSDEVRAGIIAARDALVADGWDAGADSIRDRLIAAGTTAPSRATIHRIVVAADRVTPQPRKRPRSSWIRFEAAVPNETWQSDMTHWHLADATPVEIISWMDDHSRCLLHISCHRVGTAPTVTETFLHTGQIHIGILTITYTTVILT